MKNIFKNPVVNRLLLSLLITVSISILSGLFFLNFNFNFVATSFFFFVLQVVGFYFYGERRKRLIALDQLSMELLADAELRRISADVVCPCDKKVETTIPLDMSGDNSYICSQCNKKVGVLVSCKTVLKTDPIIQDPLENKDLIETVQKVLQDPKHNDRL